MAEEQAMELIGAKLETLRLLGETGMLWWVSSSALVIALLGAVWLKRGELPGALNSLWRWGLIGMVGAFLLSIVIYGVRAMVALRDLRSDIDGLCAGASLECGGLFATDFSMAINGYFIGTTTFVFALFAWAAMAQVILRDHRSEDGG